LVVVNILLVEDDAALGRAMERGFADAGHQLNWARSGKTGLELALTQQYDVMVLDLMLPDLPGQEVLKSVREAKIQTPVLILTAMGAVEDRVAGFDLGADDYLVKPFAMAELIARLQALGRRAHQRPSTELVSGSVYLDLTNRRVRRDGKEIVLTPTEFSLLEYLMRFAGEVVTRKMLCEHLWEADWEGVTNVVEVHINRLRGKIDKGFTESIIHTIRGRGYVFRSG
jgi:two-component system OmpR family response regulator/two-component system copper resistance phosphate regulon response regulator CusR